MQDLEAMGFHITGYGCTTCIGNSGPLSDEVTADIQDKVSVAAVLSDVVASKGGASTH